MRITVLLIIFFNLMQIHYASSNESYVVLKVNNNIITNVDIDNEYLYLIALSPPLQNVEKKTVINLDTNEFINLVNLSLGFYNPLKGFCNQNELKKILYRSYFS